MDIMHATIADVVTYATSNAAPLAIGSAVTAALAAAPKTARFLLDRALRIPQVRARLPTIKAVIDEMEAEVLEAQAEDAAKAAAEQRVKADAAKAALPETAPPAEGPK